MELEFECNAQRARAFYDGQKNLPQDAPSFDELIEQGWFDHLGERIYASVQFHYAIERMSEHLRGPLKALRTNSWKIHCVPNNTDQGLPGIQSLVADIEGGKSLLWLAEASSRWIAAALWERQQLNGGGTERLRWWLDRWILLGNPDLVPTKAWPEAQSEEFISLALKTLADATVVPNWTTFHGRVLKQHNLYTGTDARAWFGEVPATMVDRYLWINSESLNAYVYPHFDKAYDRMGLVRLLVNEAINADAGENPASIIHRIFDLMNDRPEILWRVGDLAQHRPKLLADLIINPTTCALACLIIAQWELPRDAWDERTIKPDLESGQKTVFDDAVSILGHWLMNGAAVHDDVAALLSWMHLASSRAGSNKHENLRLMLDSLREVLSGQSIETLELVAKALLESKAQTGFGTPPFAALLDVLNWIGEPSIKRYEPVVASYIESIRQSQYGQMIAPQIDANSAAVLVGLSLRMPDDIQQSFFKPFDVATHYRNRIVEESNEFIVKDKIGRSLRAHIRMLSRAVAHYGHAAPGKLIKGLAESIRDGSQNLCR